MKHFAVLLSLLRDRPDFIEDIRRNIKVERKSVSLLISSCFFFAIYGAIIGSSSSWMQMIASAIKLPALYLITLVICLPTLFFFDVLFGSRLKFGQYVALLMTAMATISVLLFSFAPITLFFLISVHDYTFFQLLNVGIFGLTGLVGTRLFYHGMRSLAERDALRLQAEALPKGELPDYDPYYKPDALDKLDKLDKIDKIDDLDEAGDRPTKFRDVAPPESLLVTAKPGSLTGKPDSDLLNTRLKLLRFWLVLYALVGSQLGWTLRPFFGAPGQAFQLFRQIEGNFYSAVFNMILNFLGF
ncbi:MAG: actin-binding WH2 domain-containing protein [Cyanobacteriota bacterium]